MLAVASSPHGFKTVLVDAATLSQAHLIQPGRALRGRTPGKILLSRVLTATSVTSCRTPVVEANDAWRSDGRQRKGLHETQDRSRSCLQALEFGAACPRCSALFLTQLTEELTQTKGKATMGRSDLGKPFSKDAPPTARMITVELAHVQMQENLHILNGQIPDGAYS